VKGDDASRDMCTTVAGSGQNANATYGNAKTDMFDIDVLAPTTGGPGRRDAQTSSPPPRTVLIGPKADICDNSCAHSQQCSPAPTSGRAAVATAGPATTAGHRRSTLFRLASVVLFGCHVQVPSSIGLKGEAVDTKEMAKRALRSLVCALGELGALQGSPNKHHDEVGAVWPGHWQCTRRHVTRFPPSTMLQ
jgi:hypothetical protein